MIPRNNKKNFINKYGHLWYLRDFDLHPEALEECHYNLRTSVIKDWLLAGIEVSLGLKPWTGQGMIFDSKEKAELVYPIIKDSLVNNLYKQYD